MPSRSTSPSPDVVAATAPADPRAEVTATDPGTVAVTLSGAWTMAGQRPAVADVTGRIAAVPSVRRLTFDTEHLGRWDSAFLTFVLGLVR